jgi:hypothetical protein
MTSNDKIRAEHLHRPAFVYVRQSSLTQVRHHHESRRRQYDLQDHARCLQPADVGAPPESQRLLDINQMVKDGLTFDYSGLPVGFLEQTWIPSYCRLPGMPGRTQASIRRGQD